MHISVGALRTLIRVHVHDVHPDVGRPQSLIVAMAPRVGRHHRRLAAAVVEQLHVRLPKVPMGHAVHNVIETGLGDADPGAVVEQVIGNGPGRAQAEHYCEWQPEQNENDEAAKVRLGQRQVRIEPIVGLEVGLSHVALRRKLDAQVDYKRGQQRYY